MGIVEIRIKSQTIQESPLLEYLKAFYNLQGGTLVLDGTNNEETNKILAKATLSLIEQLGGGSVGLGWGHLIGSIVNYLEDEEPRKTSITDICPMIGNSGVPIRNYHPNENVRIIAKQIMASPHFLYTPAVAETQQDKELLTQTEQYKSILNLWENLKVAIVNIGNHPSTPDLGSSARFGNLLSQNKAVGRLIAYYYNQEGKIITSDKDYVIQIPLEVLKKCPNVIGICSANTNSKALIGALKTGLLTHIVVREKLLDNLEF